MDNLNAKRIKKINKLVIMKNIVIGVQVVIPVK